MKRTLTVIVVILLVVSFLGCLNGPSPPGADLPELIVHNPEDNNENESVINLRAMELVIFDEIKLYLNHTESNFTEKVQWNNSFGPEYRTNLTEYDLEIYVRREESRYTFNATFELYPEEGVPEDQYEEDELVYRITYYDEEEKYITRDSLPIIEPLEIMEDEG